MSRLMAPELKYGSLDGDPFVWAPGKAWLLVDGSWRPANSSEIGMDGRVLSKAAFAAKFPALPPLPHTEAP